MAIILRVLERHFRPENSARGPQMPQITLDLSPLEKLACLSQEAPQSWRRAGARQDALQPRLVVK